MKDFKVVHQSIYALKLSVLWDNDALLLHGCFFVNQAI